MAVRRDREGAAAAGLRHGERLPAIVIVPLRGEVLAFAVALKPTVPLPLPLAPLVNVSQPVCC